MKRTSIGIITICILQLGCSMNREAAKKSYLDNGNRLFEKGAFEEASLNYRKAIQKDNNFGEAYYRLGLCESRRTNLAQAFQALSRAVELMPQRDEVKIALIDTSLALYLHDGLWPAHEEAIRTAKTLQHRDSFDALRVQGLIAMGDRKSVEAIEYFRRANEMKPMQPDVVLGYTEALLAGDTPQVIEGERLALKLVAAHPDFKPIYDVLYKRYMSTNRTAEAEKIVNERVRNNPKDADALVQLAAYYWGRGNEGASAAAIDRLLANPNFPDAYLRAGDFYRAVNQLARAQALYEKGQIAQTGQTPAYEIRIIEVLNAQGQRDDAMKRVTEALAKFHDNGDLLLLQATLLIEKGGRPQAEEAAALMESALKRQNRAQYHNALGQAYVLLGNLDAADKELTTAAATPGYLEPARTLARLSLQRKDYRRAQQYAEGLLAFNANDPEARLLRATALRGQGNFSQANTELVRLRNEFPNAAEPRLELGALRMAEGHLKEAETLFQAADAGKHDLRAVKGLAQTYILQNQPKKAMQLLTDQMQAQPSQAPQLHLMLADAAMVSNQFDVAAQEFAKAAATEPKSPYVHLRWGDALLRKGQVNEAVEQFRTAHEAAPNDPEVLGMLALAQDRAGHVNEAKQAYSDVLRLRGTDAAALNNLAYLLANSGGNLDEAMRMAQEAQRRAPRDPGIADTVGWIYLKKHMVDAAMQVFTNNVRIAPNNAICRYHLALALVEKGDRAGAKKHLEIALAGHTAQGDEAAIRTLLAKIQ